MQSDRRAQWVVLVLLLMVLFPQPAMAYIGPGAGLSAIGAFLAIVAGLIIAMFGFLWYPIKRLRRKWKSTNIPLEQEETDE